LATPQELSNFLKEVERRAFKRSMYHVRNEESALDIVQDSMMKLSVHYGDKPPSELPLLFARILSNTTLDWFRARTKDRALFTNFSDYGHQDDEEGSDVLETLEIQDAGGDHESAERTLDRKETIILLEKEIEKLPARQREAFLLRYWEEMDVAETAASMGCTEGSVKTHCSRACQALGKSLKDLGIKL
jgi:RNA polymerase sigma-70 factor (ECF subfamily)